MPHAAEKQKKKKRKEGGPCSRKCIKALSFPSPSPPPLSPSPGRYVSQSTMAKLQWSTMLQRLSPAPYLHISCVAAETWRERQRGIAAGGEQRGRQERDGREIIILKEKA